MKRVPDLPDINRMILREERLALKHVRLLASRPDRHCHAARKHLKRARALLRLDRPAIGTKRYHKLKAKFKAVGQTLAELRDQDVMIRTIKSFPRLPLQSQFIRELHAQRRQALTQLLAGSKPEVSRELARNDEKLQWSDVNHGVRKSYRKTIKLMKQMTSAGPHAAAHRLHEFRKAVQVLRHQIAVIKRQLPGVTEVGDALHALSDHLGDIHDIDVLLQNYQSWLRNRKHGSAAQSQLMSVKRRRTTLRTAVQAESAQVMAGFAGLIKMLD